MGVPKREVPLGELIQSRSDQHLEGDSRTVVTTIATDSREVVPGTLFVALRGREVDSHDFLADAVSRGACAVMVDQSAVVNVPVPRLVVSDTRAALAWVAAAFHDQPSRGLRAIGVTGTDGKTTTSHLLRRILTCAGRSAGAIGSLGASIDGQSLRSPSRLTTPLAHHVQELLAELVADGAEDVIIEASSFGLAEHRLDAITFAAAVVTNISPEHVEQHGGMQQYVRAKAELVERVAASGGLVVVNADDAVARSLLAEVDAPGQMTFAIDRPQADVVADHIELSEDSTTFVLHSPRGSARVRLPLPGPFNVSNALAATAAAHGLGVGLDVVVQALESAPPVVGRMAQIREGQPFAVYVDFAHTLAAVRTVLDYLRLQHPEGRLVAVFGTGLVADYWKRPLMAQTLVARADLTVLTASDHTYESPDAVIDHYAQGAISAGAVLGRDFLCEPDRRRAIEVAIAGARPGDVVAVLGKGHEPSIVIHGVRQPWSEVDEVRAAVRARGLSA